MTIRVRLFDDSNTFLAEAGTFLLENEVVNSLMLGAVTAVSRQSLVRRRFRPLFALVEEHGAPVAALTWTLPHKPLISADAAVSDAALGELLQQLSQNRAYPEAILGPATVSGRFARLWAQANDLQVEDGMKQRLFVLREVIWPSPSAIGSMYPGSVWNRELLSQWIMAFQAEAVPNEAVDAETALFLADRLLSDENVYVWLAEPPGQELQPVAMAARTRPTERGIAINLVYTPRSYRRNGYASALVAHLSQHLLESGWQFCTLYTDISNPTSNHIYESIGYRPVLDFTEYRLVPGPVTTPAKESV